MAIDFGGFGGLEVFGFLVGGVSEEDAVSVGGGRMGSAKGGGWGVVDLRVGLAGTSSSSDWTSDCFSESDVGAGSDAEAAVVLAKETPGFSASFYATDWSLASVKSFRSRGSPWLSFVLPFSCNGAF